MIERFSTACFRPTPLPLAACLLALLDIAVDDAAGSDRHTFQQRHMGTRAELVVYSADPEAATRAATAAFARIASLDATMSGYRRDSELSRLCRTAGEGRAVRVSQDLWNVLHAGQQLADRSDGAFDVTVRPYVRLWKRAQRREELPSPERLEEASKSVGYEHIEMDPSTRSVELQRMGMRLDLGGIAKGYAAGEELDVLRDEGVPRALVNIGGDIAIGQSPPDRAGWRIGIAPMTGHATEKRPAGADSAGKGEDGSSPRNPTAVQYYLTIADAAVATSGDAYQHVEIDGVRYSHVIDPRTGVGIRGPTAVTVVAESPTHADALASAITVLGPKRGFPLLEDHPRAAAIYVQRKEGDVQVTKSARLRTLDIER